MKNIGKYTDIFIDHRVNKDGKDYYPVILKVKDVEVFLGFIGKSQYDLLNTTLN